MNGTNEVEEVGSFMKAMVKTLTLLSLGFIIYFRFLCRKAGGYKVSFLTGLLGLKTKKGGNTKHLEECLVHTEAQVFPMTLPLVFWEHHSGESKEGGS